MTTDNKTLAVDVLAVMDHESDRIEERIGYGLADDLRDARAAVAELIEVTTELRARLCLHGDWEDGCFYYNGYSAPELMAPMADVDAALVRVKGESA
ncbi:hypothetical protein [Stenotrophomonas maltophilia]|uniref:hypothetical protein n=1 Tax=Stenotrophomonas maltophilia TaxID=40324 RepID=UPI0021CA3BE1|nr:hypothetical protein [Stenotrophomonas maltophilia]MCU1169241.1 hypothetical protein [Stenotrophomonas maltophilia]